MNDDRPPAARYDDAIFDPALRRLYGGSDFFNVGYWTEPDSDLAAAASALVGLHLSLDPPPAAEAVSTVLDVGCGLGTGTAMMDHHYGNALVVGLNFSRRQASYAAEKRPAARFAAMDAVQLGIASGSVDRIHCVEAAFHFSTRWQYFAEAFRVLRPGGLMVVTDILFRRKALDVPAENVEASPERYLARCGDIGFVVEEARDITKDTLVPFFALLSNSGFEREARVLRAAQSSYLLTALRKS